MAEAADAVAHEEAISREEIDDVTVLRHEQYALALEDDRAFHRRYMVEASFTDRRGDHQVSADAGIYALDPGRTRALVAMAQLHLNSNPPPVWKLDDDVRFKSRLVSVVIGARVEGMGEHTDVARNGALEEETEPFEISKQPTSVGANGSHCQRRVNEVPNRCSPKSGARPEGWRPGWEVLNHHQAR